MSSLGYRHTDEVKRRIAAAKVGNTNANAYSRLPETKEKVAAMLRGKRARNYGWTKPGLEAAICPTLHDIYWAAGIYEGEGWCGKTARSEGAYVGQNDPWLLERMKALFGGGICAPGNTKNRNHTWHVHGARARGFLMTMYGLLSPRRQAQLRRVLGRETISLEQT